MDLWILFIILIIVIILIAYKVLKSEFYKGGYDPIFYAKETITDLLQPMAKGVEILDDNCPDQSSDPAYSALIKNVKDYYKIPDNVKISVNNITLDMYDNQLSNRPVYEKKKQKLLDMQKKWDLGYMNSQGLTDRDINKFIEHYLNKSWDARGDNSSEFDAVNPLQSQPWGDNINWDVTAAGRNISRDDRKKFEKVIYIWSKYSSKKGEIATFFKDLNESLWKFPKLANTNFTLTKSIRSAGTVGKASSVCITINVYNDMIQLLINAINALKNINMTVTGKSIRYIDNLTAKDLDILNEIVRGNIPMESKITGFKEKRHSLINPMKYELGQFWSSQWKDSALWENTTNPMDKILIEMAIDNALGNMGSTYAKRNEKRSDVLFRTTMYIQSTNNAPAVLLPMSVTFGFENEVLFSPFDTLYLDALYARDVDQETSKPRHEIILELTADPSVRYTYNPLVDPHEPEAEKLTQEQLNKREEERRKLAAKNIKEKMDEEERIRKEQELIQKEQERQANISEAQRKAESKKAEEQKKEAAEALAESLSKQRKLFQDNDEDEDEDWGPDGAGERRGMRKFGGNRGWQGKPVTEQYYDVNNVKYHIFYKFLTEIRNKELTNKISWFKNPNDKSVGFIRYISNWLTGMNILSNADVDALPQPLQQQQQQQQQPLQQQLPQQLPLQQQLQQQPLQQPLQRRPLPQLPQPLPQQPLPQPLQQQLPQPLQQQPLQQQQRPLSQPDEEEEDYYEYIIPIDSLAIRLRNPTVLLQEQITKIINRRLHKLRPSEVPITDNLKEKIYLLIEFLKKQGVDINSGDLFKNPEQWMKINRQYGLIQISDLDNLYRASLYI